MVLNGATGGSGLIGVAISTHKRPAVLARSLAGWNRFKPPVLAVIEDIDGRGVAVTKNRSIAALMDAGVEHLFLADDDMWPIRPAWAEIYISDPEPHLMHCWGKSRVLEARCGCPGGIHSVWRWPRGVLLYVHRSVIETVGGMRTEFGRWGGEHAEWTRRIHNAGLTTHLFADAAAARRGTWHCLDYTRATPSSVPAAIRNDPDRTRARHELYEKFRGSTDFVPYR